MEQMYYCPDCRALISCGDRFCGSCGVSLNWVVHQSSCQQHQQYNRQPGGHEQSKRNLPTPCYQESASGNLNQCRQRYASNNRGTVSQGKSSLGDDAASPIRSEISKLLADFFDKHSEKPS